jgi:dolichol-phosphate mannosyltransferase
MPHLSIVIPVYRAEDCMGELYRRLTGALEKITADFEVVFVEDAGADHSWERITALCEKDRRVKGIKFSRNFGQHHAITAGLDNADGDWVVVMDCDLQDQPEEISKLYRKALEGYDIVLAVRSERQDSKLKIWFGQRFYRILSYLTDAEWDNRIGSFRIMSRKVVHSLRQMREQLRFLAGMVQWLGFRTARQEVEHAGRLAGKSSYNFRRLVKLAVGCMVASSEKPLKFSVMLGLGISVGAFCYGTWTAYRKLVHGIPVEGWTSLMVSLYFLSGLILLNLGIVGLYVGRIFIETKGRPLYVIEERVGL